MRKVTTEAERAPLERAQAEHIKNVQMYRQTQSRLNALSEQAVGGKGSGGASLLKLDLDGLDQFRSVTHIFGEVGHTHGPLDQRLSVVDFVEVVKQKIKPVRNRELRAEVLLGGLDFKDYYHQLGIYETYPHAEADCILLVKHLVNSECLSQKPLTFAPFDFVQKITEPLASLPRNLLSERARKEWERFAPGPVREVVVQPDKKILPGATAASKKRAAKDKGSTSEPKKRGRPPKRPVAQGSEENPFTGGQSESAPVAVPQPDAPMEIVDDPQNPLPLPSHAQEEPCGEAKAQPPPPTRSTFAGRTRVGSEAFQSQWDSRRELYYKVVPADLWKDPLEREYWTLCSHMGSLDAAVAKFLENKKVAAVVPTPAPRAAAAPAREAQPPRKPQSKAKAKAKVASRTGRGRARGRKAVKGK
eukprot:Skav213594  [mRNA]  locus=scaffold77:75291:78931:+ [translate_table: standard]